MSRPKQQAWPRKIGRRCRPKPCVRCGLTGVVMFEIRTKEGHRLQRGPYCIEDGAKLTAEDMAAHAL